MRSTLFNTVCKASSPSLTVRLLVTGTSTWTTKLLGLAAARIGDKEGSIKVDQNVADFLLGSFVDKFLVICDNGLGESLADGINLAGVTTTIYTDADVKVGKAFLTENKDGFKGLQTESFGLNKFQRDTVHTDHSLSSFAVGNGGCGFLIKSIHNKMNANLFSKGLNRLHSVTKLC